MTNHDKDDRVAEAEVGSESGSKSKSGSGSLWRRSVYTVRNHDKYDRVVEVEAEGEAEASGGRVSTR